MIARLSVLLAALTVAAHAVPQPSSLSPNSGNFTAGPTVIFEGQIQNLSISGGISFFELILETWPALDYSCHALVIPEWGMMTLHSDNSQWIGGSPGSGWITPTNGLTHENSKCRLLSSGFTISPIGANGNVTVRVPVQFKDPYTGFKALWMLGQNAQSNSGWVYMGAITVTGACPGNSCNPSGVSVTPSSGSGLSQNFETVYQDSGGSYSIAQVNFVLGVGSPGYQVPQPRCKPIYGPHAVWLETDTGGWEGPAGVGSNTVLSASSSCSLNAAGVVVTSPSINQLRVVFPLTFKTPYFSGLKNEHLFAADNETHSGWTQHGTWSIGSDTTPPVISSVSPNPSSNVATISWQTDEGATSQVLYGETTAYGNQTALDNSMVLSHSQTLSNLRSGRTYYYQVRSADAFGNLAIYQGLLLATPISPDTCTVCPPGETCLCIQRSLYRSQGNRMESKPRAYAIGSAAADFEVEMTASDKFSYYGQAGEYFVNQQFTTPWTQTDTDVVNRPFTFQGTPSSGFGPGLYFQVLTARFRSKTTGQIFPKISPRSNVSVDRPTATGPTEIWHFEGQPSIDGYSTTGTFFGDSKWADPPAGYTPTLSWRATLNPSKVSFSPSSGAATTVTSLAAAAGSTADVRVVFSVDGFDSTPLDLFVNTPVSLDFTTAQNSGIVEGFQGPTGVQILFGYVTAVYYRILDKRNAIMQPITIHERIENYQTRQLIVIGWPAATETSWHPGDVDAWPLTNEFLDGITAKQIFGLWIPSPIPPRDPVGNVLVQDATQKFFVGSGTPFSGKCVQRNRILWYDDHGGRSDVTTPVNGELCAAGVVLP